MSKGTLYIVATPLGNRDDITIRALKTLCSVDIVLCEDTRKTGTLIAYYQTTEPFRLMMRRDGHPRLISYYDEVEEQKLPEIIELLESGTNVALVSDAGTPLISDPGFLLVRECRKRSIPVSPIPGPSSILAALSVSGLPTDKFTFLGYLPKKQGKRITLLKKLMTLLTDEITKSVILFETPRRLQKTLADIQEVFGNREIVIARELTKVHEEVWKGQVHEAIDYFTDPKGEFVLLISRN